MPQNRAWTLASFPSGAVREDNFKLIESAAPAPKDGEVLVKNLWLSLDPYMRGRMNDAKSYAKPAELGQPMVGGAVSEVVASKNAKFAVGDIVLSHASWQDYALSDGAGLRKLVMVTSHGGNIDLMAVAARELRVRLGMLVVHASWRRLGLPEERFHVSIAEHGNMVAAGIPYVLDGVRRRLGPGVPILALGTAAGYTQAAALFEL